MVFKVAVAIQGLQCRKTKDLLERQVFTDVTDTNDSGGRIRIVMNSKILPILFDMPFHVSGFSIFAKEHAMSAQVFRIPNSGTFRAGSRTNALVGKTVQNPIANKRPESCRLISERKSNLCCPDSSC